MTSCKLLDIVSRVGRYTSTFRQIHIAFSPKFSQHTINSTETPLIPLEEACRFIRECMQAVGTPEDHAQAVAKLLVEADYRGHFSHGMNRLDIYLDDVESGICDSKATPVILKENEATAWVDGKNGLGAVVGNFSMKLAIEKAKKAGVGWVATKGSNHYGIAGMYAMQAVEEGLLGMSFTNTSPFMVPTRARQPALGTNPLALGAPSASAGDSFVLDMATTAVAVGKVEIQRRKGAQLPSGWALDKNGQNTQDPNASAGIYPLGGEEINSGYKGFGLGTMVEVFCGILSGSTYGPNIRKWGDTSKVADLGQCFIALDPECFAPGFETRMQDLMDTLRCLTPADPNQPVLVAGDAERQHMKKVDEAGGVIYLKNQYESCAKIAAKYNVKPLQGHECD